MKRNAPVAFAALAAAASVAGCSGHTVADPFAHGVTGGRVVANYVICDPTPTTCGRYVVIDPAAGTSQATLISSVEATVQTRLGWRRSPDVPVPSTQGVAFDGPRARQGAFVNTATAELALDTETLDTGASAATGKRVLAALHAHQSAVVVRIISN